MGEVLKKGMWRQVSSGVRKSFRIPFCLHANKREIVFTSQTQAAWRSKKKLFNKRRMEIIYILRRFMLF